MSGRKNIYQQYGAMPNTIKGKDIWIRNDAFLKTSVDVYCRACGKTIEMPSSEGPGAYSMDIYQIELKHAIHHGCARELDRNGINY
jgi:hypothetical protein